MKNKNNATDQVVVTKKESIVIEKQEAAGTAEHLAAYKKMILK